MVLTLQFISDKSDSIKEVSRILKKVGKKKVCYVTLNKSCGALQETFGKKKNIVYIDGISSTVGTPKAVKDCKYVNTPYHLKPIASEINKALKAGSSVIIFDSLSNFLSYGSSAPAGLNILINFIKSFSTELKKKKGDVIFLCKKEDKENFLIEETIPAFDKVVGGKK